MEFNINMELLSKVLGFTIDSIESTTVGSSDITMKGFLIKGDKPENTLFIQSLDDMNNKYKEFCNKLVDFTNPSTPGIVLYSAKMLSKDGFRYSSYIKQNKINKRVYAKSEFECIHNITEWLINQTEFFLMKKVLN